MVHYYLAIFILVNVLLCPSTSTAYVLHPVVARSLLEHRNHTGISPFSVLNRRSLGQCPDPNPYLEVTVSLSNGDQTLSDEEFVTVTVSGVLVPSELDWVAMISPSDSETDVEFVFFTGGFDAPCILTRSGPLKFANPNQPLYSHISSIDSSGTSMKVTWVSGSEESQEVRYGDERTAKSEATTFTNDDMCSSVIPSPAKDFGWHDPGYIHSAVLTGLDPSTTFTYKYGSDSAGWSDELKMKTPPAGGSDEVRFLAYGDMGKAPRDPSAEHYIQPGSLKVVKAMTDEVESGNVDSIFHIGDISYATGFLVEWDYFLQLISPMASRVSYMTAIGNHERDYANSGSVYDTSDSGGECGVPYETYFPMPTSEKDKPWYSIEQGSVHFTVISTEHPWSDGSEQLEWIKSDLASVDRTKTPWLVFAG
ncbi:Probable inactive purple acid phosphatase 27 [Linum perenne]